MTLRAPSLLLGIFAITSVIAAPGAISSAVTVRDQAAADVMSQGGFNSVLASVSAIFDATTPSTEAIAPVVAYAALWVILWGALLNRFAKPDTSGIQNLVRAGFRWLVPMGQLTLAGLLIYAAVFAGVHSLFFQNLAGWLEGTATTEQAAFAWRFLLYTIFGTVLLVVSLVIDFARVRMVIENDRSAVRALARGFRFLREQTLPVTVLTMLTGGVYVATLGAYGAFDLSTRGSSNALTATVVGQLFIALRVGLRLLSAASQVRLVQLTRAREAVQTGSHTATEAQSTSISS